MFRAYDRSVVAQLLKFRERRRYIPSLVGWLGVGVREIPVEHLERGERGSRYRLRPLVDMLLDMVTGYATFPLRTVTVVGLFASLLSDSPRRSHSASTASSSAAGFPASSRRSLCSSSDSGVQLFLLALVGEYVGRIYIEAKARPYYIVSDITTNR